jgi:hypothetical protein
MRFDRLGKSIGYTVNILYLMFLLIGLSNCDKIEAPFTEKNNQTNKDTLINVLIEDFTGFKCGNCPNGHKKLDSLQGIYGDRLISIGIHAGFYAKPDNSGNFTNDYRSETGNEIDSKFKISALGLPKGMINRVNVNSTRAIDTDGWGEVIEDALEQKPSLDIKIANNFTPGTLTLNCAVTIKAVDTISQPLVLSIYVVEDSIRDWQRDYNPTEHDIQNYVHRNILRDAINGTWGSDLQNGMVQKEQEIYRSYTYNLNSKWNYKHIYVVAFVYNRDSYEVLQSRKARIY